MRQAWQLETFSEDTLLLRFGEAIDPAINQQVHEAACRLQGQLAGVECVPAYASLLLRFDPADWGGDDAHRRLGDAVAAVLAKETNQPTHARLVEIPVQYGGDAGPDLAEVASHAGLSVAEVIRRHSAATYRVAMLGFAPGFPYLLGLDRALSMPRRADPRLRVPAGSVAIGGLQTGIYPQMLPGGWQLIGRTPLALFDLQSSSPSLLQPGDEVRFRSIDEDAFRRLAAASGVDA